MGTLVKEVLYWVTAAAVAGISITSYAYLDATYYDFTTEQQKQFEFLQASFQYTGHANQMYEQVGETLRQFNTFILEQNTFVCEVHVIRDKILNDTEGQVSLPHYKEGFDSLRDSLNRWKSEYLLRSILHLGTEVSRLIGNKSVLERKLKTISENKMPMSTKPRRHVVMKILANLVRDVKQGLTNILINVWLLKPPTEGQIKAEEDLQKVHEILLDRNDEEILSFANIAVLDFQKILMTLEERVDLMQQMPRDIKDITEEISSLGKYMNELFFSRDATPEKNKQDKTAG